MRTTDPIDVAGQSTSSMTDLPQVTSPEREGGQPRPPLSSPDVQLTLMTLMSAAILSMSLSLGPSLFAERPRPREPSVLQHSDAADADESTRLKIDINLADPRELALLPGVGPVLARRIVNDRQRGGAFAGLSDLIRVHGIGEKTLRQIRPYCDAWERPASTRSPSRR